MSTALRLTVAEHDAIVEKGTFNELQKTNRTALRRDPRHEPCRPHSRSFDRISDSLWSVNNTDFNEFLVRVQCGLRSAFEQRLSCNARKVSCWDSIRYDRMAAGRAPSAGLISPVSL